MVTKSGENVAGIVVDVFTAGGDGSRAEFVRGTGTDSGMYRFQVEAGCYVVVQIAPDGYISAATSSKYQETAVCVDENETQTVDGLLIPA